MIVVHRFHIEPTKEQEQKLFQTLVLCRRLYNAALEQREICYRQRGKSPSCTTQKNELPELKKELPEYKQVNAQVLQDCLQRLDNAFQRFWGGLAGYPHYKDRDHYRSFTYPQADKQDHFKKPGYIYLPKIGYVKMKAHFEFDPTAAILGEASLPHQHCRGLLPASMAVPTGGVATTPGEPELASASPG